ncbi:MAG TPA: sigma 54-interacting transcriptional regulator [Pyrinomonadaceae bacterium]
MSTTTAQIEAKGLKPEQYLTLLDLSKAIASHGDLTKLFHDLACRLQALFKFRSMGVTFYDPKRNLMKFHFMETCIPTKWQAPTEAPIDGSIAGWVWQHQEPVVVHDIALEEDRFPFAKTIPSHPIKAICSFPLTTANKRLGALNFWSEDAGVYDEIDIEFTGLLVGQIAVAIEAQCHQQKLAHERDRYELLLEINHTLVSNLNLRELISAVSGCLRRVLPHDVAGLALYDPTINKLRATAMDFPDHEDVFIEDDIIELDGTLSGRAFTTRLPVMIGSADLSTDRFAMRTGLKTGCKIPLISHDRVLGVLGLGRLSEEAFTDEDCELLTAVGEQVAVAVENALAYRKIDELKNKLQEETLYLQEEIRSEYNFEEIIGTSPTLRRALEDVQTVAPTDSTVLIFGETGTGKELIARALHNLSGRSNHPLVKVNCAAIPTGLLESEMFGHERGAFTGAVEQRKGRFELAHRGTIFLDEVEEIPLELQPKLLRVLQEQEFERLGSGKTIKVDVRVIAATNADLAQMVAEKKFRSDLYYRLNVFPIVLPALRERAQDISLLVHFFAQRFAQQMKKPIKSIPADAIAQLTAYNWPGNIRELQNLIERAVILSRGSVLEVPLSEIKKPAANEILINGSGPVTLEAVEREHIIKTLREAGWVIGGNAGAAARLGLNRTTLNNRMRKLGITRPRPE